MSGDYVTADGDDFDARYVDADGELDVDALFRDIVEDGSTCDVRSAVTMLAEGIAFNDPVDRDSVVTLVVAANEPGNVSVSLRGNGGFDEATAAAALLAAADSLARLALTAYVNGGVGRVGDGNEDTTTRAFVGDVEVDPAIADDPRL